MAFDTSNKTSSRLSANIDDTTTTTSSTTDDGYTEIIDDTLNSCCNSKPDLVVATQSWVKHTLKQIFCRLTNAFHTHSLFAKTINSCNIEACCIEAANGNFRNLNSDEIYATGLTLVNEKGNTMRMSLGEDGKIIYTDTSSDVYYCPNNTLIYEYFYKYYSNIAKNFAGLTEEEIASNFVPYKNDESTEYDGQICYFVCKADGERDLVDGTLLITMPENKVAKSIRIFDENNQTIKTISLDEAFNTRILTINMPCFTNPDTGEKIYVKLPYPFDCNCIAQNDTSMDDLFGDDEDDLNEEEDNGNNVNNIEQPSDLDPDVNYEVEYEVYTTPTYYNIILRRSDFNNISEDVKLFFEVEVVPG